MFNKPNILWTEELKKKVLCFILIKAVANSHQQSRTHMIWTNYNHAGH
jgi:hypothetical protein